MNRVSEAVFGIRSRPADVFPFGFRGESVSVGCEVTVPGFLIVAGFEAFCEGSFIAVHRGIGPVDLVEARGVLL